MTDRIMTRTIKLHKSIIDKIDAIGKEENRDFSNTVETLLIKQLKL